MQFHSRLEITVGLVNVGITFKSWLSVLSHEIQKENWVKCIWETAGVFNLDRSVTWILWKCYEYWQDSGRMAVSFIFLSCWPLFSSVNKLAVVKYLWRNKNCYSGPSMTNYRQLKIAIISKIPLIHEMLWSVMYHFDTFVYTFHLVFKIWMMYFLK